MENRVESELARRIDLLEDASHQGEDFDPRSWLWFAVLGVACPLLLLAWGSRA